jgi:hypothetical protein
MANSAKEKRPVDIINHCLSTGYRTRVDGKPQDGCFREKANQASIKTRDPKSMPLMTEFGAGLAHQTVGHSLA